MMKPTHRSVPAHPPAPTLLVAVLAGTLAACTSGSSSDPGASVTAAQVTLPTGDTLLDVPVVANQTTRIVYTHAIPPTTITSWKPNLSASLGQLRVTIPPPASPAAVLGLVQAALTESASVMFHIAPADQRETVCTGGVQYGPYVVGLSSAFLPTTVAPTTATANAQTLSIMNAGPFAVCLEVLSPVGGSFSLDGWVVDVEHDCATPATNFAGTWSGTFQCSNTCTGQPMSGSVQITVTQDASGRVSYTDDGGDTFSGTACGNEVRFVRNAALSTERGVLRLTGANRAENRSSWRYSLSPFCGGECVDVLSR